MGKGDRKSAKGKIWRGSHGKKRPKKSSSENIQLLGAEKVKKKTKEVNVEVKVEKPKVKTKKKASSKDVAADKK